MKPQIKRKWLNALRSGKYKQTQGHLSDNSGFCCLGVLCDLYAKDADNADIKGWELIGTDRYNGIREFNTNQVNEIKLDPSTVNSDILPPKVVEWAGLNEEDPFVKNVNQSLSELNDQEYDFIYIANIIEEHL